MNKKAVSTLILTLLLTSTLAMAFNVQPVETELSPLTVPEESAVMQGTINLVSQEPPPTEWNKTYGGTGDDFAWALVQTADGGYAIAGRTGSFGAGRNDFWLVKTDASGNAQWNKTYGGYHEDEAYALVQTADGGYALAGWTGSYGAGIYDFWLVKTDANGNALWNKTYGGTSEDYAQALIRTADGGYAIAGYTGSWEYDYDFWLVKTDANGNAQWNNTYAGTRDDEAWALVQTADGGYALTGWTGPGGVGDYTDFWLVKTDVNGNAQWNKTYGGYGRDRAYALVQAADGGYALAGTTNSYGAGSWDFWLVKTDASGNAQWNKTYGGTGDDWACALVQAADGGYALAGLTGFALAHDFWLVKTDVNGNVQWNKTYGGTSDDWAYALVQTVDGGYALAGWTNSYGAGSRDFWLVKVAGVAFEDFSLSASPNTETMYRGCSKVVQIGLTSRIQSHVSLGLAGLPHGMSAYFNPSAFDLVPGSSVSSELTISSTLSAPPGTHLLTIVGSSEDMQRTCSLALTLNVSPDYLQTAQSKRSDDENAYLWQIVTHKGQQYHVFLYSKSVFSDFSIQNWYVDQPLEGSMRIKATTAQGEEWVNIEGVIIIDQEGSIVKDDETSRTVLTLAEAQAYYRYFQQNNLRKEDFDDFLKNLEDTTNKIYGNPLLLPVVIRYHLPPPTSMQLYKELLTSVLENPLDLSPGTSSAKDDINKYISTATGVVDNVAEYLELKDYKQFISQSPDLQELVEKSDYLGKFDRNLKDLFDKLEEYRPYSTPGKYFVKFLIGIALKKTVAEQYLPYLKALKNYVQSNPKSSYDSEWSSLRDALTETINMVEGPNSMWYKMADEFFDVAWECTWDVLTGIIAQKVSEKIASLALEYGLSISQVGSITTSMSVGVGIGIIAGDILFDMSTFFRNLDLMVKARKLNSVLNEVYDKISSTEITGLEANIETRKLQFSLVGKMWGLLADNADGGGLTGAARDAVNDLVEFLRGLLGLPVQSTEEYVDTIKKVWIPYYSFMRSLAVPPLHYADVREPGWKPFFYTNSSTAVVNSMMFSRRGLNDPCLMTSMEVDRYFFHVNETGNANITIINPSAFGISDVWINATSDLRISIVPQSVHIDSLQPHENVTVLFQFSFNQPGMQALSFWIDAENGTYIYAESALVNAYLQGLNVTVSPALPLLGDNVVVTVTNSSSQPLCNATVFLQSPLKLANLTTNASGMVSYPANSTGLWFVSVVYPNEPTYGPSPFMVSSSETYAFDVEMDDVNSSSILPNRTFCKGFRILNGGTGNLSLQIHLREDAEWLTSWLSPCYSGDPTFENATIINATLLQVEVPVGHWTAGFVLFSVEANATLGFQTTLTMNVSDIGASEYRAESFNVTVDTRQMLILLEGLSPAYHGDNLTAQVKIKDGYGNLSAPDLLELRFDYLNGTSCLSAVQPGFYNLSIPNVESGQHILEVSAWKNGFENETTTFPITVQERTLGIQLIVTQENSTLDLSATLNDTINPRNMSGASVWGVLEDQEGNKTTVIFTETQPEAYKAHLLFNETTTVTVYNLTISASKTGYESHTLMTSLEFTPQILVSTKPNKDIVGQDFPLSIDVHFKNNGNETAAFNVTTYAGSEPINNTEIVLAGGSSTNITIVWDTTGWPRGNYTIQVVGCRVSGLVDIEHFACAGGIVRIGIPGDVDPVNGYVGIDDIFNVATHFGQEPGLPEWNAIYDITGDSYAGVDDIFIAAQHFGQEEP